MPANSENSAVATRLEKVSFHSNPKEEQCQRMFKLLCICTHFTCQQGNAQNSSTLHELRNCRYTGWVYKRQRRQIKLPTFIGSQRKQGNFRKTSTSVSLTTLKLQTMKITTNWRILKETRVPDHLTCLLKNLYAGQEAIVRTRHQTTDWFKIGKGV